MKYECVGAIAGQTDGIVNYFIVLDFKCFFTNLFDLFRVL